MLLQKLQIDDIKKQFQKAYLNTLVPKICATIPFVGGTVDSHNKSESNSKDN